MVSGSCFTLHWGGCLARLPGGRQNTCISSLPGRIDVRLLSGELLSRGLLPG
jgi:hypothetical protein